LGTNAIENFNNIKKINMTNKVNDIFAINVLELTKLEKFNTVGSVVVVAGPGVVNDAKFF